MHNEYETNPSGWVASNGGCQEHGKNSCAWALQYQGLDLPNLYTRQMVACVTTLMQYGPHEEDVMDSLIRFTTEAFHLKLKVTGQVFDAAVVLALGVMDSWIKACWLNMAHHDIHITLDTLDFLVPWAGDCKLMWLFIWAGFCMDELATLNCC